MTTIQSLADIKCQVVYEQNTYIKFINLVKVQIQQTRCPNCHKINVQVVQGNQVIYSVCIAGLHLEYDRLYHDILTITSYTHTAEHVEEIQICTIDLEKKTHGIVCITGVPTYWRIVDQNHETLIRGIGNGQTVSCRTALKRRRDEIYSFIVAMNRLELGDVNRPPIRVPVPELIELIASFVSLSDYIVNI